LKKPHGKSNIFSVATPKPAAATVNEPYGSFTASASFSLHCDAVIRDDIAL
jgi:hypothetical protein